MEHNPITDEINKQTNNGPPTLLFRSVPHFTTGKLEE